MFKGGTPRVGWILVGDERYGSARIQGFNIHRYLVENGVKSTILRAPASADHRLGLNWWERLGIRMRRFDVVVFQKVFDEGAIHFAARLRSEGTRTVFVLCDVYETEMISSVDLVVVTSQYLVDFVKKRYGVNPICIDDALELSAHRDGEKRNVRSPNSGSRAIWVGSRDNWEAISEIVEKHSSLLADLNISLVTISDHPSASFPWSLERVQEECRKADFALLPTGTTPWALAKSSNRLSMFLSMGLPVIATSIPSYERLASHVGGVRFVESDHAWAIALSDFTDASHRHELIHAVPGRVRALLDIKVVGPQWRSAILGDLENSKDPFLS